MKKNNVLPEYEKGDHRRMKNYRLVSPLPVFSKITERLIYNAMFKHDLDNSLISPNQSDSNPGEYDS